MRVLTVSCNYNIRVEHVRDDGLAPVTSEMRTQPKRGGYLSLGAEPYHTIRLISQVTRLQYYTYNRMREVDGKDSRHTS
jgi:hypothetical protein